ncbi:MAG: zinc ribbon domain-containing protein [Desulfatirhabdiaceae bacterium]|nr:zinc ribbon domain-containing protein [Desulfatirhabdiaceae bacterium]
MPIYEFKCLKCNECFEILFTSTQDTAELKCTKCDSQEIERVLSSTNFSVSSRSGGPGASTQTRSCSSGSCSTFDIPGPG